MRGLRWLRVGFAYISVGGGVGAMDWDHTTSGISSEESDAVDMEPQSSSGAGKGGGMGVGGGCSMGPHRGGYFPGGTRRPDIPRLHQTVQESQSTNAHRLLTGARWMRGRGIIAGCARSG